MKTAPTHPYGVDPSKLRIRPNKALGQHFLTDRNILSSVADSIDLNSTDLVVEIGPGKGSLTDVLASKAGRVIAIELDEHLASQLAGHVAANVKLHVADARSVKIETLLAGCPSYKLAGNLPYYAAMPILRHFLESPCKPEQVVVLLQREVARQVCANPGYMSLVSLAIQLYGRPRIVRWIRPGSFYPRPKVMSAMVHIQTYVDLAEGVDDAGRFFTIARAGFSAPRKQLRNSLAQGLAVAPDHAQRLLELAGLDYRRRAESLSLGEWARLYRAWLR